VEGSIVYLILQNKSCVFVCICVCIQPAVWLRERSVPQVACPVAITVGVIIMGGERITLLYSIPLTVACREACTDLIEF